MILTKILQLLGVAVWTLGLLPSWTVDTSSASAAVQSWDGFGFFGWADHYLPVSEAVVLIGVRLTLWAAMHAVEGTLWLLTKAHVLGGSS
jgi:hypothetical protein